MSLFRIKTLAKAQATQSEIEAVVGYPCTGPDEQEAIRIGRLQGVAELREKQYDRAMKGDTAAMTALGKHLLGQAGDGVQINISITDILKRSMTLRNAAVDSDTTKHIATRSDDVMVLPPGENDDGSGAAFEVHTEKNPKIKN
jgi:hypothetical protein